MRKEHELADCIKWGWIYHHTGIPTTEKKDGEVFIPHLKFYVSGFPTSPFGIEWMRFEEDCPMHPLIKKVYRKGNKGKGTNCTNTDKLTCRRYICRNDRTQWRTH